ncbi:MAG: hypothetical protein NZ455_15420 [Bacteroidia bacterium]|nr:hypothetical protein [Bacteroidia bacterium]MDW8347875.1 hypothetical protein [Bacteroidia bacterium]
MKSLTMKKVILLCCLSPLLYAYYTVAQQDTLQRKPAKIQDAELKTPIVIHTIKIENQSFWLDGKLIPKTSLPLSLQTLPQGYSLSIRISGADQFKFCVLNNVYLYANKKITEISLYSTPTKEQILTSYYQDLKKQDPETFERLSQEAALEKKSQEIAIAYNSTPDKQQKEELENELRTILDELFEIKTKNTEREILRLQGSVEELRKKLTDRRKNKEAIIQKRISILIHKEIEAEW